MKLIYKILLVNLGLALLFAWLIASSNSFDFQEFAVACGLVSLVGGAIDILIGLVLFLFRQNQWAQGYLITAGLLLLIGTAAYSIGFVH